MSITVNTSFNAEDLEFIKQLLPLIIPLLAVQLGLLTFVIIDIAKKANTKNLSPLIWIIIAVCLSNLGIGPILYIVFGRAEKIYKDDDDI